MTLIEALENGHFHKYDGRIIFIVKRVLGESEFKRLLTLFAIGSYPEIAKSYDQFKITINELSSNTEDHKVEVGDKTYYLVGNYDQFTSQFTENNN